MQLVLFIILYVQSLPSVFAAEGAVSEQAPIGWTALSRSGDPDVLTALKGPGDSSFLLTRVPTIAMDNPAACRAFLEEVLSGVNQRAQRVFKPSGPLTHGVFPNGLRAWSLRADEGEKGHLILALAKLHGVSMVATVVGAAPEIHLPTLLSGIHVDGVSDQTEIALTQVESSDGQLHITLGLGVTARLPSESESREGAVLALRGLGSDLIFFKRPVGQVPQMLTNAHLLKTSAGPLASYVVLTDIATGYLPWAYWGYALSAHGPQAGRLLVLALEGVSLGPSAQPKLIAQTPDLVMPMAHQQWSWMMGAALIISASILLFLRSRRAK